MNVIAFRIPSLALSRPIITANSEGEQHLAPPVIVSLRVSERSCIRGDFAEIYGNDILMKSAQVAMGIHRRSTFTQRVIIGSQTRQISLRWNLGRTNLPSVFVTSAILARYLAQCEES